MSMNWALETLPYQSQAVEAVVGVFEGTRPRPSTRCLRRDGNRHR
jgi:hypothetical protein